MTIIMYYIHPSLITHHNHHCHHHHHPHDQHHHLFSYDPYIEVAFTHTTISSYHLDISCTCITIITIIIMNMNFQQYHASVHATMQPVYPMYMQNDHIIIIIL